MTAPSAVRHARSRPRPSRGRSRFGASTSKQTPTSNRTLRPRIQQKRVHLDVVDDLTANQGGSRRRSRGGGALDHLCGPNPTGPRTLWSGCGGGCSSEVSEGVRPRAEVQSTDVGGRRWAPLPGTANAVWVNSPSRVRIPEPPLDYLTCAFRFRTVYSGRGQLDAQVVMPVAVALVVDRAGSRSHPGPRPTAA